MNYFKILVTSLLIVPSVVFSQKLSTDFNVTTSTPYEVVDAGAKEYISLDNGYTISLKMGRGQVTVQKFSVTDMKEVARNSYKDLPDKAFFLDFVKLGNRLFCVFEAFDSKSDCFKVYSREIDTDKGSFLPQQLLLTTSRKVANPPFKGDLTRAEIGFAALAAGKKFNFSTSFDQSKFLITYRLVPADKNDAKNYDELGFFVFDGSMTKIWGKEIKMPYVEKQMNNTGFAVGSDGSVKMLITNNVEKNYEILNITAPGDIKISKIGVSAKKLVRNMSITESKSGKFVCGGYYANGIELTFNLYNGANTVFNANGLIYLEIGKDGSLLKEKYFDFSKEFIMQNLSDNQKKAVEEREKEGKAGILDLFMTHFAIKEDGTAVFVGECQYMKYEFYNGPSQANVYHFSNAVVIKVNENGELAWMVKLPKNQAGIEGAGQMGIAYMPGTSSDYVAYIDNPKNIALSPTGGVPVAHKDGAGGFLTSYKINNATGALEKHTIFDLKDVKGTECFQFKPWRIVKSAENEFLVETYIKGKKDMMIKIGLKK